MLRRAALTVATLAVSLATTVALLAAPDASAAPSGSGGEGTSPQRLTTRVVNGRDPGPDEFGFLVALESAARYAETKSLSDAQFCGGSLVSSSYVVTAAHCLLTKDANGNPVVVSPNDLLVASTRSLTSPDAKVVDVIGITVNPGFDPVTEVNDVAVLRLGTPLAGVPTVRPVTAADATRLVVAGRPAWVAGWGSTSATDVPVYPDSFKVGRITLFPDSACGGGSPYAVDGVTFSGWGPDDANPAVMLCGAGVDGKLAVVDSCFGDSGGPLVVTEGSTPVLAGIVAFGERCAGSLPGVYSRVSAFEDFLRSAGIVYSLPPKAPVAVASVGDGFTRVAAVTPPAADTPPVISYSVTVVGPGGTPFATCTATGSPGICDISGLENGVRYTVTATATNTVGTSPASRATTVIPAGRPGAPTITRITAKPRGVAAVSVKAPADSNGRKVTSLVVRCTAPGRTTRTATVVRGTATVTGLVPGYRYRCNAIATNAIGSTASLPAYVTARR